MPLTGEHSTSEHGQGILADKGFAVDFFGFNLRHQLDEAHLDIGDEIHVAYSLRRPLGKREGVQVMVKDIAGDIVLGL